MARKTLTNEKFDSFLTIIGLTKKEFAELANVSYDTVTKWHNRGIPSWVESWLINYIDAQKFKTIQKQLQK
jgi:DNA-binding transcriptional regulator YiaG